jgi:hypothetical protein
MQRQDKINALNLIQRLERRCSNMRLEFKMSGHQRKNDMDTMLSQLEVLKVAIGDVAVDVYPHEKEPL